MAIDQDDTDALRNAVKLLEHPSLAARLTNMVGKPVELLGLALPAGASQAIATATTKGLEAALKVALLTIRSGSQESSQLLHRTLAIASGAAGGALPLLRHIILNDDKSPTYKLALLRVLCRRADEAPGYARDADDERVTIPLGLVGLYWIRLFKPLLAESLP